MRQAFNFALENAARLDVTEGPAPAHKRRGRWRPSLNEEARGGSS